MAKRESAAKPSMTGCGVLKKIRSDSPKSESRQINQAAPAPKKSRAAGLDRGKLRAADPIAELFQSKSPPIRVRNNPGKRVAVKRLIELSKLTQRDDEGKSNQRDSSFVT